MLHVFYVFRRQDESLIHIILFHVSVVTRAMKDSLAAPRCVTPTVPGTVHVSNLTCVAVIAATRVQHVPSSRASPGTSAQVNELLYFNGCFVTIYYSFDGDNDWL